MAKTEETIESGLADEVVVAPAKIVLAGATAITQYPASPRFIATAGTRDDYSHSVVNRQTLE